MQEPDTEPRALPGSLLLAALSEHDGQDFVQGGLRRDYAAGQGIFLRGDPADALFVIESGRVEISVCSRSGRKSVIGYLSDGELLGEIALLDGGLRSADAGWPVARPA